MSFIDFQKSSGKRVYTHDELDKKLEDHCKKRDHERSERKKQNYHSSLSLDGQWMLPNLEKRFKDDPLNPQTYKKKRAKEKRKKSKHSSSSDSESKDEEIDSKTLEKEKHFSNQKRSEKKRKKSKRSNGSDSDSTDVDVDHKTLKQERGSPNQHFKRDDWMNISSFAPTFDKKKREKEKVSSDCIIAAPGQSDRELNPYWKDGGTGLPSNSSDALGTQSKFGDRGLEWYEKALQRAQETAKSDGRSLADVVAERWGSLDELMALISKAKSTKSRRRSDHDESDRHPKSIFHKPREEYGRSRRSEQQERGGWRKREEKSYGASSTRSKESRRSRSRSREHERDRNSRNVDDAGLRSLESVKDDWLKNEKPVKTEEEEKLRSSVKVLTDEELNALAAKLVKAEILGKADQINKLKKKLAEARTAREKNAEMKSAMPVREETIILMETNRAGTARPVEQPIFMEPKGGRRKPTKVETHNKQGQRERYFADDDQRDLQDMYVKEKHGTADDDKELYLKMAAKRLNAGSDEEDAAFADAARLCASEGKRQQKDQATAMREALRRHRTLDNCMWCLDSPKRTKHLIVAIGETCYLCLPAEEPLSSLHCLIVPIQHALSGVVLDEDAWDEMRRFRQAVVAMAKGLGEDVVFFEQARSLQKHPHMVMHCAMIPKEAGDTAPIYFKKALQDCENEWSNNKKVVDIKGLDVRGTVPKGLPYFSVEFPPQGGFAHIIEDEKLFPSNFAQSVIGGMLDLDHSKWRKPKNNTIPAQRERSVAFARKFAKYDFTVKKKRRGSSSSSSSSLSSSSDSD